MADLIAAPLPRQPQRVPRYELTDELRWGRYFLCERVPSGGDDECYIAALRGAAGYERYLFLRRFPKARLDPPMIERLKRVAMVNGNGLEQVFELGVEEGYAFVLSGLIEGIGLDQLDAKLVARGGQLPWQVALALVFDASDRIGALRSAGALHEVTPARLRFAYSGTLYLCHGVPATVDVTWGRALLAIVRPSLRLAATAEERALLDDLLDDPADTDALEVASDALVLRHPELDLLLPMLVRAVRDSTQLSREPIRAMLAEQLDAAALRSLWAIVGEP